MQEIIWKKSCRRKKNAPSEIDLKPSVWTILGQLCIMAIFQFVILGHASSSITILLTYTKPFSFDPKRTKK